MEEARMYHEGYKEGLDECYGQVPIRGDVMPESSTVDDMASFGAHTPAMEDEMQRSMSKLQMGNFGKPYFISYLAEKSDYLSSARLSARL
jgi:hypothetical protein